MNNFSVGECVRFKAGVKDYDYGVDIGGWQGRVIELLHEHGTIMVAFDSITLRNMPGSYVEICEEEGLGWSEYGADPDDLETAPPRDTTADVEAAIAELSARYAYSYLGEEGREMNAILAGVDPQNEMAVMERWGDYLGQTLTFPFEVDVVETLFDRGPIRYGDRLRVLGINMVDDAYGVLADVLRGRKSYVHPLCDLETRDHKSLNHDLLRLYRVWFANR